MSSSNAAEVFDEFEEDSEERDATEELGGEETSSAAQLPLNARISCLLFVSPKALSVEALAKAAAVKTERVEKALEELREIFVDTVHGFSLSESAGAWQFRTHPGAARTIQRLIPAKARRLSRAAAETLAVIAYKQPVQRAEVEAIRGVDALPTLKTLLEARLIRIVGRADSAGHPALYGTTQTFLEKFGLKDLSELPTIRELEELMSDPGETDTGDGEEAEVEGNLEEESGESELAAVGEESVEEIAD